MPTTRKPYDTEPLPSPIVAEPAANYGNAVASKTGRMTADEYFSEVRKILLKKYEDIQG